MAGILLGLLHHGDPVAGLTWLPFVDQRYTAVVDGPLMKNGVAQPPLAPVDLADALIGAGSFSADARGRFPGRYRIAVLENLSRVSSRLRMHGSTGLDLAYVADGVLGGSISFGGHVWDHAAGVALVRAAGGVVTDVHGEPWTPAVGFRAGRGAARARRDTRDPARHGPAGGLLRCPPATALRCGSFRAWTSTPGGWSRGSTSKTCAMRAIPSSSPPPTTPRAPTSSPFSTSPPRRRGGPPCSTWCAARPSRFSSR